MSNSNVETKTESHEFQAEVSQVLKLVINSLYSNKEIFIRELVSNAADAIDKLKYRALTDKALISDDRPLQIRLSADADAGTLTIADDGIGMRKDELIDHLGTVAHSGTQAFLAALEAKESSPQLIGQFGVGFYSAFLVADRVEVISRAAGHEDAWRWSSDGQSGFDISTSSRETSGTSLILHMREEAREFLTEWKLRGLVTRYADFVSHPILVEVTRPVETEGDEPSTETTTAFEQVNEAKALWQRPKSEITDDEYKAFYSHLTHDWEPAMAHSHFTVEGTQLFTGLLYIPKRPPFDLFSPTQSHGIRLYVKRVFIMDDCDALLPKWLRFARGIVDSDDLPLNVSRELLQDSKAAQHIQKQVSKKLLGCIESLAADSPEDFSEFWTNYGLVLKEGLHLAPEFKDRLSKLVRFKTSSPDHEWTSLEAYVERMQEGQDAIYYVLGESEKALAQSPHLEALHAKGLEVLYMVDAIDEWAVAGIESFDDKPLVSAMKADLKLPSEEESTDDEPKDNADDVEALIKRFKLVLSDDVSEVRVSQRLTSSPCCLVMPEGAVHAHVERILQRHTGQGELTKRILELNPDHDILVSMTAMHQADPESVRVKDWIELLYDQALMAEGSPVSDPARFASHVTSLLKQVSAQG